MKKPWTVLEIKADELVVERLRSLFENVNAHSATKYRGMKLSGNYFRIAMTEEGLSDKAVNSEDAEQHIFHLSEAFPKSVFIITGMNFPLDGSTIDFDNGVYGFSAILIDGKVVAEKELSYEDPTGVFWLEQHEHQYDPSGKIPACGESHYGYIFEVEYKDSKGKLILSRRFDDDEAWSDYTGFDKILEVENDETEERITGKEFLEFADSEAELLMLETIHRAAHGSYVYPSANELDLSVLEAMSELLYPNTEKNLEDAIESGKLASDIIDLMRLLSDTEYRGLIAKVDTNLFNHGNQRKVTLNELPND